MQAVGPTGRGGRFGATCVVSLVTVALGFLLLAPRALGGQEALIHVFVNGAEKIAISTTEIRENVDVGIAEQQGNLTSVAEVASLAGIFPEALGGGPAAARITVGEGVGNAPGESLSLTKAEVIESPSRDAGFRINSVPQQIAYEQPGGALYGIGANAFRLEFSVVGRVLPVSAKCVPAEVGKPVECRAEPGEPGVTGWTYSWDFGDEGGSGVGQEPKYTYLQPGTYSVTVTAEDREENTGRKQVKVRVAEVKHQQLGGDEEEGNDKEEEKTPARSESEVQADQSGTGTAPPGSVSTGPDKSKASRDSKGRRPHTQKKRRHRAQDREPVASELGFGGRGGPGAGNGTADGLGGGAESGATTGPGAASPEPGTGLFEESQTSAVAASPEKSVATPSSSEESHPSGPLIEGIVLGHAVGVGGPSETSSASLREAERQQQAAAGGQGSGGSVVETVIGGVGVLGLLGIGGAAELISAGRRKTWVMGAGS
jgi:PKD repeat protein